MSSSNYSAASGDTSLGIGRIISGSLATVSQNFLVIFVLCLPLSLTNIARTGSLFSADQPGGSIQFHMNLHIALSVENGTRTFFDILNFAIFLLCACATTRVIYDQVSEPSQPIQTSAIKGAERILPMLAICGFIALFYIVGALLVVLSGILIGSTFGSYAWIAVITVILLFGCLMIPFTLSGVICIGEERGPVESMRRSQFLTKSFRWSLLGMIVLVAVLLFVFILCAVVAANIVAYTPLGGIFGLILTVIYYTFLIGWTIAIGVLACIRLRSIKEGVMTNEALSTVFE